MGVKLRAVACLLAAPLVTGCQTAAPRPSPPQPARPRPNVVLIVGDDLDLAPLAYMPILKAQLADRGTSFRNAFVTKPVCAPSRASILTGRYVHNHGLKANKPPLGSYQRFVEHGDEAETLAVWLQTSGYRTGLVGKYLNRYPTRSAPRHVPAGWSEWHALFFPEAYWHYRMNENGEVTTPGETDDGYQTDVLTARAVDFIQGSDGRPFFLYVAPFAPHAPALPAPRHQGLFSGLKAPRPPSFNEEDVSDKPAWVRALPPMTDDVIEGSDERYRRRVRAMQAVDEMVGTILGALEARDQLSNTYVVFTSDNGFQQGAHRMDHGKGDPYDESTRVPMIVRGPGVRAGRVLDPLVLNIDLAPTIADLAGAHVPPKVDGRSLVPWLLGSPFQEGPWRRDFLIENFGMGRPDVGDDDQGGIPNYFGLRSEEHLYVEYPVSGEKELYDLRQDPYLLTSHHADADPALLRRLSTRLAALKSCDGAGCRP